LPKVEKTNEIAWANINGSLKLGAKGENKKVACGNIWQFD
jgi:hypothetical protein